MALRPITVPRKVAELQDSLKRPIGTDFRRDLQSTLQNHGQAITTLALGHVIYPVPYGSVVQPNLSHGAYQKVVVTNGDAFIIKAPINITGLAEWTLIIVNSSGGAMGSVTFGSGIVESGFTAPTNGNRKSTKFLIDGTNSEQETGWQ